MTSDYLVLKVSVPRQHAEMVETAMLEIGAVSCTYQDATDTPIHEPAPGTAPLWPEVIISGIYAQGTDPDIVTSLLRSRISSVSDAEIVAEVLPDTDWERAWMEDFEPVKVAASLWVVPTFCTAPDPSSINIALDPGLAFGSGTHPTTHLCLQWLAKQDLNDKTVVDYGCGSGILAVAAAMMGAKRIYAYDIDPQAFDATVANAERNNVADNITICHSDKDIPQNIDIVVANILLAPLLELRPRFGELLNDQGKLGVSGRCRRDSQVLTKAPLNICSIQYRRAHDYPLRSVWIYI